MECDNECRGESLYGEQGLGSLVDYQLLQIYTIFEWLVTALFYTGNVLMYDLITFLALNKDLHSFISFGAWFQALVESFIKEFRLLVDFPSSIIFPDETDLEVLIPVSISIFFTLLLAYAGRLTNFHISVSFIFAFSWLTEHMFRFLSIVLVV